MFKKVFVKFASITMALGLVFTLAACGEEETEAVMESSHSYGEAGDFEYEGTVLGMEVDAVLVDLYDDGTYRVTKSSVVTMNGSASGSTFWEYYGEYEKGEPSSGFKELTLQDPTRAIYTSYSTMGGYAFQYDSATVEDWSTVELAGGIAVEDEADFLSHVPGETFYIALNSNNEETAQLSKSGAE